MLAFSECEPFSSPLWGLITTTPFGRGFVFLHRFCENRCLTERGQSFLSFAPNVSETTVLTIQDGWVSSTGTRDPAGFQTIFFGQNSSGTVVPYDAWTDFPAEGFLTAQPTPNYPLVKTVYWEHQQDSWPVPPPSSSALNGKVEKIWKILPAFVFGPASANAPNAPGAKPMTTIVSYEQAQPVTRGSDASSGHMEVLYFTVPYGLTRWESWSAASCASTPKCISTGASGDCTGVATSCMDPQGNPIVPGIKCNNGLGTPDQLTITNPDGAVASLNVLTAPFTYTSPTGAAQIDTYTMLACADWSTVVPAPNPAPIPFWPVPQSNLLQNFHFADSNNYLNQWTVPASVIAVPTVSTDSLDLTVGLDGPSACPKGSPCGIRYTSLACAGTSCQAGAHMFQNIPITSTTIPNLVSGNYGIGITARTEIPGPPPSSPMTPPYPSTPAGTLAVTLVQIDADGAVLVQASSLSFDLPLTPTTGTDPTLSIVLSSAFGSAQGPLTLDPNAAALQLQIAPQTPNVTFDLVDVWVSQLDP